MANAVLVDSNIFIGLLRQGIDPARALHHWAEDRDLVTCGMVRIEVVRGIRLKKTRRLVERLMDVMVNVPADNTLWEEAAELAWQMDRMGRILPAQDIFIAAAARRVQADLITDDGHFGLIPGFRVIGGLDAILGRS